MKAFIKLSLLFSIVFLSGCVPSLRGIADDKNTIFDDNLLGYWQNDDGKDTWEFVKQAKNVYGLEFTDADGKKGLFRVKMVKIDKLIFLDIFPEEMETSQSGYYKIHYFPVHTFILAEIKPDRLVLSMMSPDAAKEFLDKNPGSAGHKKVDDRLLLTGSGKQIRKFLLEQAENDKIFPSPQTYSKKTKPVKTKSVIEKKQTGQLNRKPEKPDKKQ